jgi:hypothetical protein
MSIVVGRKKELPEGLKTGKNYVFVGDCLKKYRDQGLFAIGCPPVEPGILYTIIDHKNYNFEGKSSDERDRYERDVEVFQSYIKDRKKKQEPVSRSKKGNKRKS